MSLTANVQVDRYVDQEMREFPVGASVTMYKGARVGIDPAGYAKPFVPGDVFAGFAFEQVDNASGAAGAEDCMVEVAGDMELTIAGVAIADVGAPVFATADDAQALTGHPDAFIGRVVHYVRANVALVRLRTWGESPPNGIGSITMGLTGHEAFAATGATAGTAYVNGFELESILGPGFTMTDAEDGGIKLILDGTAEVALASVRTPHDILPVDKGITFEADVVVSDKGDAAAVDFDFGVGTALTANSEADIDHSDMAQLFGFHTDGNSDNILLQSDDDSADVAPVDTTIDNDSTTDVPKHWKGIVRPDGTCEGWIDGVRMLPSQAFAVDPTANLAFFANAEKTSDDSTFVVQIKNLVVKAGASP